MEVSCTEKYKVTTRIQTNHYQRTKIPPFIHTDEEGLVYIFLKPVHMFRGSDRGNFKI